MVGTRRFMCWKNFRFSLLERWGEKMLDLVGKSRDNEFGVN